MSSLILQRKEDVLITCVKCSNTWAEPIPEQSGIQEYQCDQCKTFYDCSFYPNSESIRIVGDDVHMERFPIRWDIDGEELIRRVYNPLKFYIFDIDKSVVSRVGHYFLREIKGWRRISIYQTRQYGGAMYVYVLPLYAVNTGEEAAYHSIRPYLITAINSLKNTKQKQELEFFQRKLRKLDDLRTKVGF